MLADAAIGGSEQLVEVLPRVVATGVTAFDLHDDKSWGLLGDAQYLVDLLDGAWLECDPREVVRVQGLYEFHCLIERWDTSRDNHAVDGRTVCACLGEGALACDLAAPLRCGEIHGVELCVHAWLEEFL